MAKRRELFGMAVLGASVVVVVLTTVMLIVRAAPTLSSGLFTDSYSVPMDATMTLEAGSWVVFELTGFERGAGPATSPQNHAISLTPDQVDVTGPTGNAVPTSAIRSKQTITLTRPRSMNSSVSVGSPCRHK